MCIEASSLHTKENHGKIVSDIRFHGKNKQIAQLELENEQISKELFEEKLHTRIVVVLATGWLRLLLAFPFFLGFIGASTWIVGCGGVCGGA
ncbi:hypothetical protein Leryth_025922 [Lithospermum erythrorhizon]|nr:hypothetical protein Leryth_025922 [Lithospermum erythrorhizon]